MKIFINILLAAVIAVLGWQLVNLYRQYSVLKESADKMTLQTEELKTENTDLNSDIKYFSNTDNLEKELKSKTNYKNPEDKMIIVVPPKDSQINQ